MRVDAERPEGPGIAEEPDRADLRRPRASLDRLLGAGRALRRTYQRLPLAWRRALVAVLVLRLALAVAAVVFGGMIDLYQNDLRPVDVEAVPGTGFGGWDAHAPRQQGYGLLGGGLERFDTLWYLAIAEHGYPGLDADGAVPGAAAFFPAFPLLVGVLGRLLLGRFYLAASLLALAAAVAALAGVHRLIEEETGDESLAGRALVALAVFPSAFFLVAPYTEGLFLATTAWALVWARRGAWGWAGALAVASAVVRNLGVLIAVALVVEVVRQWRAGRRPGIGAWAAAVVGAPAGLAAVAGFSWARWGTPLGPISAQTGWEREWMLPTEALGRAWRFGTETPGAYPSGYHTMDLLVFAVIAAAVVWLLLRVPLPYGLYGAAHVLLWLVYPFGGRPLMSTYRFAVGIAPLAWAFGAWTRRQPVATAWWAVSAGLQGALFLLFVNWFYIF